MTKRGLGFPMQQKLSGKRITAKLRSARALELRLQGYSYPEIGKDLGITHQAAYFAVERALKPTFEEAKENADTIRELELQRLDVLLKAVWDIATQTPPVLTAVDKVLKIMERRSKLLGLDALERAETNWREEVTALLKSGKVTQEQLTEELGIDLATELFVSSGITVTEAGESSKSD